MMRSSLSHPFVDDAEEAFAAFEINPPLGPKHLLLFAIRGGVPMPRPEFVPEARWAPVDASPEVRQPAARVLRARPNAPGLEPPEVGSFIARPVRGPIVRDSSGQSFEVVGRKLRPLARVVQGPRGSLLELLPAPAVAATRGPGKPAKTVIELAAESSAGPLEWPSAPRFRTLLAQPGLPCAVPLGPFKTILAPKLAHPERLRDVHRLPCILQIYESTCHQPMEDLLDTIRECQDMELPIQPLSDEAVAQLGVAGLLARRPRPPLPLERGQGFVFPFDRFFQLRLVSDPTVDLGILPQAAGVTPMERRSPAAVDASGPPEAPTKTALSAKCEIPERFLKPWDFQLSREEALYDMNVGTAALGPLRPFGRCIRGWFRNRKGSRKWQALLRGRDFEEQLWAVRPARGSLSDPAVREWARITLEAAGYESCRVLLEWEIFWRRKGV